MSNQQNGLEPAAADAEKRTTCAGLIFLFTGDTDDRTRTYLMYDKQFSLTVPAVSCLTKRTAVFY